MLFVARVGFSMMGKRTAGRCEILVANIKKVASCCASNFLVPHYFMTTFPVGKNQYLVYYLALLPPSPTWRIIPWLCVWLTTMGDPVSSPFRIGWVYGINGITVTAIPPLNNVTDWEPHPPPVPLPEVPSGVAYEVATKRRPSQARLQIATLHMLRHQIGAHLSKTRPKVYGGEDEVTWGRWWGIFRLFIYTFIHLFKLFRYFMHVNMLRVMFVYPWMW